MSATRDTAGTRAPLKAIAAMAENRVIGHQGTLPWHLPEDLKIFKRLTTGCPIVMGRNTWDSLPFKPLPKRQNIVVSGSLRPTDLPAHVTLVDSPSSLETVLPPAGGWLIGGSSLYEQLLPTCSELFLSLVYGRPEGDAYFPPFENEFTLAEVVEKHEKFELHRYTRTAGA